MDNIIKWPPLNWMSNLVQQKNCSKNHEVKANLGNTYYKIIQDMFCDNTKTIKAFTERCNKYDTQEVLTIPTIVDPGATHPQT